MLDRKGNRLSDFDYSQNGYYFVTICTKNRKEFFGEIKDGRMTLNRSGEIIKNQWLWLGKQYDYVRLDEYMVMPNHFHGILIIEGEDVFCRDRSRPVPTVKIKSLSSLIGAFKSRSSKDMHDRGFVDFAWQRSFHDHIIRNEKSLAKIRQYISDNPAQWEFDRNNPDNLYT